MEQLKPKSCFSLVTLIYQSHSGMHDSSSEYSPDSNNVNIRPTKRQKTLVIDSDTESENETDDTGECSFASADAWIEIFHEN